MMTTVVGIGVPVMLVLAGLAVFFSVRAAVGLATTALALISTQFVFDHVATALLELPPESDPPSRREGRDVAAPGAASLDVDWATVLQIGAIVLAALMILGGLVWAALTVVDRRVVRGEEQAAWAAAGDRHDRVDIAHAEHLFTAAPGGGSVLEDVTLPTTAAFYAAWQVATEARAAAPRRPHSEHVQTYTAAVDQLEQTWRAALSHHRRGSSVLPAEERSAGARLWRKYRGQRPARPAPPAGATTAEAPPGRR